MKKFKKGQRVWVEAVIEEVNNPRALVFVKAESDPGVLTDWAWVPFENVVLLPPADAPEGR